MSRGHPGGLGGGSAPCPCRSGWWQRCCFHPQFGISRCSSFKTFFPPSIWKRKKKSGRKNLEKYLGEKIWGKENLGKKNLEKSEFFPPSIGAAPSTSNEDQKRATTTTTAKKSCKPTNLRAMKIHGFFLAKRLCFPSAGTKISSILAPSTRRAQELSCA